MTNTTTTPNMLMVLPVVGVQIDPTWATNLITALTNRVDTHNHTEDNGVKVPTAGILIDNDFILNHFNLLSVNTVSLDSQLSVPPLALDNPNRLLISYGDDLYWQRSASVAVKITDGANINIGAVATNVWQEVFTSTSAVISPSDTFTYIMVDTTGGPVDLELPAAVSTTQGRYYIVKDVGGAGEVNNITVIPDGTDTIDGVATTRVINQNYGSFFIVSNGTDGWNLFTQGSGPATASTFGTIILAGDLAGAGSIASAPRVSGINSATVPVGGALTANQVLMVGGPSALIYDFIINSNVDPAAAIDGSKIVPDFIGPGTFSGAFISVGALPADAGDGVRLSTGGVNVRDSGNLANVNLASLDVSDQVHLGDALNLSFIDGAVAVQQQTITTNYTIDTVKDNVIFVDSTGGAIAITMAVAVAGRSITIKDVGGVAATFNITLTPVGAELIEGLAAPYVMDADFQALKIVADTSLNWWIVGTA